MLFFYVAIFLLAILFRENFDNHFIKLLPILIIMAGILPYGLFKKNKLFVGYTYNKQALFVLYLLLGLTFIGIFRSSYPVLTYTALISDIVTISLFVFFIYIALSYIYLKGNNFEKISDEIIKSFIIAVSCISILFLFLLFFFASEQIDDGKNAVLLQAIGIHYPKRKFPLLNVHPNLIGIFTGGIFVMNVLYLTFNKKKFLIKALLLAIAILSLALLLIVDSRGTFFNVFLALSLVFLLHWRRQLKLIQYIPLLIPLLPMLLVWVLPILAQSELMSKLGRSKEDLLTGNSRAIVWQYCFDEIADAKPVHVWGYGEYGHYKAGISQQYGKLFGVKESKQYTVTHNLFLQLVLDIGYLGFVLLMLSLIITLRQLVLLYQRGYRIAIPLMGYLLYYIFSGTTESVYGTYGRVYLYITLAVILLSNVLFNEYCIDLIRKKKNENLNISLPLQP